MNKGVYVAMALSLGLVGMAQTYSVQGSLGYFTGFGGNFSLMATGFDLPVGGRLGVTFAGTDLIDYGFYFPNIEAGEASNVTLNLDLLLPIPTSETGAVVVNPYVGLRYNFFAAQAKNYLTDLDISSNQFGMGAGALVEYPLSPEVGLFADLGLDYFWDAAIEFGAEHYETSDPGYDEVRRFLNAPETAFKLLLGVRLAF
jgi:hypothetical protein